MRSAAGQVERHVVVLRKQVPAQGRCLPILAPNPDNAAMGSNDWQDWWLRACGFRGNQFESALPAVLPQAVDELKIHGTSAWLQRQQRKPIALQLAYHAAGNKSEFNASRNR
jgi:hypothetical protein